MANLIIHVGPGKCGSSSIQHFFLKQERPCEQKVKFEFLDPTEISTLNHESPNIETHEKISKLIANKIILCDTLILSHEYLFQCPLAIYHICNIAKSRVSEIIIIGYSRKQSSFIISAYSQWLFRSPKRVKEVTEELSALNIDPILFTGLERQLIASISNDFHSARQLTEDNIIDWNSSYKHIAKLVKNSGVKVKCGVLPRRSPNDSLIQDFCEKANLILKKKMKDVSEIITNTSFNHDLIETMNTAITFGFKIPTPHSSNESINFISSKMLSSEKIDSDFLTHLKAYIDSYYAKSNNQLCETHNLDKDYFYTVIPISKQDIMDIIKNEVKLRFSNPSIMINKYRLLSAKMALASLNIKENI